MEINGSITQIILIMNKNKLIEVCDECRTASCWYGEFLCQKSGGAGTVLIPVGILERLELEDRDYWSEEKLLEVYGTIDLHSKINGAT